MKNTVIRSALLVFLEGENQGADIRMNPPREITIGRSEECDVFLGEKKISRRHCKVIVSAESVMLKDLSSTNGTLVNKKTLDGDVELKHDDLVQLGNSLIKVTIEYEAAAKAAPAPVKTVETARSAVAPAARDDAGIVADYEASSGAVELGEESSKSLGLSALTRENKRVPIKEDSAPRRVSAPVSNPSEKKNKPLSGDLSAMGLADLVQNLAQNAKTGAIKISGEHTAEVVISDGKIVGASLGPVRGKKAFYRMLGWKEGEFEFVASPSPLSVPATDEPIQETVEKLLMDGFREVDEIRKIKTRIPDGLARLRLKPNFVAPLSKLHPRVLDVLQLVLNHGDLEAVLDESPSSDLETIKMVYYLIKKEYIEAA